MTKEQAEITARVATEIYGLTDVKVYEPVSIPKDNNYSVVRYPKEVAGKYYDEYGDNYEPVENYAADINLAMKVLSYIRDTKDDLLSMFKLTYDVDTNWWKSLVETKRGDYAQYASADLPSIICRCMLYANTKAS